MTGRQKKLILEQVSDKLKAYEVLKGVEKQPLGWVHSIRTAINMSLSQLGKRVKKTPQGIKGLEEREKSGAITIQSLREIADALDMELVYAIVPKSGTLEDIVDRAAEQKAESIVRRTSKTMELEDQKNKRSRLIKASQQKKDELKNEMPKFLWD